MLAELIEELTPQLVRRIVPRLPEQTPAWEGHVEGILSQIVAALRQAHVDASGCDVKLTFTADVESFLRVIGVVEGVVYDALDERRVTPAVREMRLLAAWFMAVRDKTLRSALRGLTATLDALPDAIHVEGTDGRFVWLNRAMATFLEQLTGLTRDEVIGRDATAILDRSKVPISRIVPGDDSANARAGVAWRVIPRGLPLPTPEGPRWRAHSVAPVRAPDDTIEAMAVANRDIHARKVAEARLQLLSKVGTLHEIAEYEGVLSAVARLSIPELADWCVVDVVEDGRVRRAKVAHRDPSKIALAEEILADRARRRELSTRSAQGIMPRRRRDRRAVREQSRRLADVVARLGAGSIMIVPFVVLGAPIAVAVFVFTPESGRRHGPEDLALAQEMARRAAQIIENARLHEQLRQSEQRFRVALSRSNISVFEEDTDFRVKWIYNSPFGATSTGATHPTTTCRRTSWRSWTRSSDASSKPARALRPACDFVVGGERRHFLLRYEPLHGVAGIVGITGAAIDVTELKRVQDELAQALGFRDRVIGVLGHDLRNPLSAVTGLAGLMLQQEQLPDNVREGLKRMLHAGDRMNEMIETVLEFTRLRYGAGPQLALSPAELDGIARADRRRAARLASRARDRDRDQGRPEWPLGRRAHRPGGVEPRRQRAHARRQRGAGAAVADASGRQRRARSSATAGRRSRPSTWRSCSSRSGRRPPMGRPRGARGSASGSGSCGDRASSRRHDRRPLRRRRHRLHSTPAATAGGLSTRAACSSASISMVISSLSPTTSPPLASACWKVMPNSLRLMVVRAEKPTRSRPSGSRTRPPYSTSSVTSRVMPRMVRSPVIVS